MAIDSIDHEKGPVASTTTAIATDSNGRTPLELFQILVGIHTPPSLAKNASGVGDNGARTSPALPFYSRSRSDNVGLYQRAKDEERQSRIAYLLTSYISNTLYMLQILLAATFTGLSAYKDANPVTLTVLGALNTVTAGCLAWQKGQGVPQRYRKAQDQYQALILEIEMTERSFLDLENSSSSAVLDARAEKVRLQKLFDTAKADQQANYPDLYVSTGATVAKETKDLTKQLEDVKAEAAKTQAVMVAKLEAMMQKLEGKVEAKAESVLKI